MHCVPGELSFALIRDDSFAVEVVLYPGQWAFWRPEIFQNPGREPPQEGNVVHHGKLCLVDSDLVILGPAIMWAAALPFWGAGSELTHDERLVLVRMPARQGNIGDLGVVPAQVLVATKYIKVIGEWIIKCIGSDDFAILLNLIRPHKHGSGGQAGGVKRLGSGDQGLQEFRSSLRRGGLIGNRP